MNTDLLKAIQSGLKLRKSTSPPSVTPPAAAVVVPLCSDSEQYAQMMRDTFLETIYPVIQPFSFDTEWIPMDAACITALIDDHRRYQSGETDPMSPEMAQLADAIDRVCARRQWNDCFVRLSSSSPKDAVVRQASFAVHYRNALRRLLREDAQEDGRPVADGEVQVDLNTRLRALYAAGTAAMRITSGVQAVRLMIASDRLQDDVPDALREARRREEQGDGAPALQVCVRPFVQFDVSWELRAFVHQGRLTALTQYNPLVYLPRLHRWRLCAQRAARSFVEERLLPRLPAALRSCVVDLILQPQTASSPVAGCAQCPVCAADSIVSSAAPAPCACQMPFAVAVVELNPLAEFAGTGLFSWATDRSVLLGQRPFESRVLEAPPVRVERGDLAREWADWALTPVTVRPTDPDEAIPA